MRPDLSVAPTPVTRHAQQVIALTAAAWGIAPRAAPVRAAAIPACRRRPLEARSLRAC